MAEVMTAEISSMTGFARAEAADPGGNWVWELRSVNHRTLDLRWRLPSGLDELEPALREAARQMLRRGSVQATLTQQSHAHGGVQVNRALLETFLAETQEMAARVPGALPPRVELLLGLPGVIQTDPASERTLLTDGRRAAVTEAFRAALSRLCQARFEEGSRLGAIVAGLLDEFAVLHTQACSIAAGQSKVHMARLTKNLEELIGGGPGVSAERLAQEVALLATRSDVREELDRLASHLTGAHGLLSKGGPVGRELDFLVQEFFREINTVCSKSWDMGLTSVGLRMKTVMEQMREQIQNLE